MARSFTSWNKMVARLSTHRKKLFNLPWFQGVILLACVVIAMLLANLPATRDIYFDVLEMDPFDNNAVVLELTGEEIVRMMLTYCHNTLFSFPFVGGMQCEITLDETNPKKIKSVRLLTPDGKTLIPPTEGSFYETRNIYNALIYYKSNTDRADRLVGVF